MSKSAWPGRSGAVFTKSEGSVDEWNWATESADGTAYSRQNRLCRSLALQKKRIAACPRSRSLVLCTKPPPSIFFETCSFDSASVLQNGFRFSGSWRRPSLTQRVPTFLCLLTLSNDFLKKKMANVPIPHTYMIFPHQMASQVQSEEPVPLRALTCGPQRNQCLESSRRCQDANKGAPKHQNVQ